MSSVRSSPWRPPSFHMMALAPIDVWIRLLFRPPVTVPLRYWPRLAGALLCSTAATIATLPERCLYALWARLFPSDPRRLAPPLFILGFYRSGTTHLHYMLSCDARFCTPRWFQTLAPQGFALTWAVLRFLLVPFLPVARFQDEMRFGANAPAEDDFALNNWALASSLPGRAVVPAARAFYGRFDDLQHLTREEGERWRGTLLRFVHKLSVVGRGRRVLLKTPIHTARVSALLQLFPRAQFVHISRDPAAVLRSNSALLRVVQQRYSLQGVVAEGTMRAQVFAEYGATEDRYLRERAQIPAGQLAEVRLEDLRADPLGELQRVYGELGLPFTAAFRRRLVRYLDTMRDYAPNDHAVVANDACQAAGLAALARRLGHDRPPITAVAPPRPGRRRSAAIVAVTLVAALGCVLAWSLAVHLAGHRWDWLIWPAGVGLGLTTRAVAKRTDHALGLWASALAVLTLAGAATASTWLLHSGPQAAIDHLVLSTISAFRIPARLFWLFMGLTSAYKLAAGDQT